MTIDIENISADDILLTSDENSISSNVHQYFLLVENGSLPPTLNQQFISSIRNSNGETLLIAAARA